MSEPVHCRCGGEAEIFHIAPDEGCKGTYCVRCSRCLIQTPFFKSKEKAIIVWNRVMGTTEKSSIVERTAKVKNYQDPIGMGGYGDCSECGAEVNEQYTYCPNCGARLEWNEPCKHK